MNLKDAKRLNKIYGSNTKMVLALAITLLRKQEPALVDKVLQDIAE